MMTLVLAVMWDSSPSGSRLYEFGAMSTSLNLYPAVATAKATG